MSIVMKFSPDLVLRNVQEYHKGNKTKDECIPEKLAEGEYYTFLKKGQRAYWLEGEQPLLEKSEDGKISLPLASVIITEVVHYIKDGTVVTRGTYKVKKIITKGEVYFNGCEPVTKEITRKNEHA